MHNPETDALASTQASGGEIYAGLLSGTSMDGVDAALVRFVPDAAPELMAAVENPLPPDLVRRTRRAMREPVTAAEFGELDALWGEVFADAARCLLRQAGVAAAAVRAIGSHGQTLWHAPTRPTPFTWQIGDPTRIAEATGITTVADFRRRDMAAGGEGAPLVPAFHRAVFQDPGADRAVLNIGGIANVTLLPAQGAVAGFDTGPGNTLLDAWARKHLGRPYDAHGRWAASGRIHPDLLERLLAEDYFRRPPPKSTGPERFHLKWVERALGASTPPPAPEDVQATLVELTACTAARAILEALPGVREILVCGGGARNAHLMTRLAAHLPGRRVRETDTLGVPAEWVEAMAFAWLARETLEGRPGNLPSVTGARRPVILGAIHPAPGFRS